MEKTWFCRILWVLVVAAVPPLAFSQTGKTFSMGTNLSGPADYATELPFVDLMHTARVWYTKDAEDPEWDGPWNTEAAGLLSYRPDGYPTKVPQAVAGKVYEQKVATIWGDASGWPEGTYVVLFDGEGALSFGGRASETALTSPNRMTFRFLRPAPPEVPVVELVIDRSAASNPVRNIRVLMPGSEATYRTQPFNPLWLEKLKVFSSVRFMDWGATNHWGQPDPWTWDDRSLVAWKERQTLDRYTWADGRGIPYEMMIRLMNEAGLDGWVCIPHRADPGFVRSMSALFQSTLDKKRRLTVEYSNEVWNWMFGQAQWLKTYGHPSETAVSNHRDKPGQFGYDPSSTWPEKITGNIQDALDLWTQAWGSDLRRLVRVVGVQTGWLDVGQRVAFNLRPGSFDAIAPAYYFGLSEEADQALDALGPRATVADVARWVRTGREKNEMPWLRQLKTLVADRLGLPLVFYEGGQHLTPIPFGQEPSYAPALLAIQRHPVMKDLYLEWFEFLKTLRGSEPLVLMNFSFVGPRSAPYGSWGLLETLDQDLAVVPAPKHQAVLEALSFR